jgi:hypothetical protein
MKANKKRTLTLTGFHNTYERQGTCPVSRLYLHNSANDLE